LDYSIKDLEYWYKKIEELALAEGLSFFPQVFNLVSSDEMTAYEVYSGPAYRYPHWSFGKAYERKKVLKKYNIGGLTYELVINTNPCIAYLVRENTLLMQILTMAHVLGHNDFFKNNRLFTAGTDAANAIEMFKNHSERIEKYINDPRIGYEKVERVIDAAHSIRFQAGKDNPDMPGCDLVSFIVKYGRLEDWQKDILSIIMEETLYFIPQIETKIINEGWACYWHRRLLGKLDMPEELKFELFVRHNQVVRPYEEYVNPYYLGFKLFEHIEKAYHENSHKIFEARTIERDESFIRRYLTKELISELKLYEYRKMGNEYVVTQIADEEGWVKIRDTIAQSVGMGAVPCIIVADTSETDNALILEHVYDGRELDLNYAAETLKHVAYLWGGKVILNTVSDGKEKTIFCNRQRVYGKME